MDRNLTETYNKPVFRREKYSPAKTLRDIYSEAIIQITFKDGRTKELEVDDKTAKKIISTQFQIKADFDSLLKRWVELGGWTSEAATFNIINQLKKGLQSFLQIENEGVFKHVVKEIQHITDKKQKGKLKNFEENLNKKSFSGFHKKLNEYKHITNPELLMFIRNAIVFTENNVNVGPGEVLATLYSEAINPQKGDLFLPSTGEEIELKATSGRPSGGSVLKGIAKGYNKIYQQIHQEGFVHQYQEQLILNINKHLKDFEDINNTSKVFIPYNISRPNSMESIFYIFQKLIIDLETFQDIINPSQYEKLLVFKGTTKGMRTNVDTQILKALKKYNINTNITSLKIQKLLEEVYNLINLKNYEQLVTSNSKIGEITNFNSYFSLFDISDNEDLLAESISWFARDTELALPLIKKYIKSQRHTYSDSVHLARNMIGGLQVIDYQEYEKFVYIIFYNSNAPLGLDKQVVIGPFTDNYKTNVEQVLKNINKLTVIPGTGAGSIGGEGGGKAYGGFQILVQ